jgi:outer membrane immunogenic protein
MKRLLLIGTAFAALIAGSAIAAAQAPRVYRRPVVATPVYSWTGFYLGGNVGYSWGDARTTIVGGATTVALPGAFMIPQGFPGNNVAFADSNTTRLNGVIGGFQAGYNYQFSPTWVLGFEVDIQASGERGSNAFADPFSTTLCTGSVPGPVCKNIGLLNGTAATAYDGKIAWFGTVRGRLGVLITDQVLLYGTGGLAYGRVELSGITNINGSLNTNDPIFGTVPFTPASTQFNEGKTAVGFAAGGGVEGQSFWLPAGWTWKLEYLYVDLGSVDTVAPFPGAFVPIPRQTLLYTSPFTGPLTTHTRFIDNIVRVGLNYKFGNYYAPVLSR